MEDYDDDVYLIDNISGEGGHRDDPFTMVTTSAGVTIIDEFRITTPRAMTTAEGYDVKLGQGINMSGPRSVTSHTISSVEDGEGVQAVPSLPSIKGSDFLSKTYTQQSLEFREKLRGRMDMTYSNRTITNTTVLINEDEETKDSAAPTTTTTAAAAKVDFVPWITPPLPPSASPPRKRRPCRKWVQLFFSSMAWDVVYVATFTLWTLLRAAVELVPVDERITAIRSYIDRSLLAMSLIALVPYFSAICYRLFDPMLINEASREERRFWGVIFVLGIRSAAHGATVDLEAIKALLRKVPVKAQPTEPTAPLPPMVRYYSKSKEDGTIRVRWACRVCGQENASQVYRMKKGFKHHTKVIAFRSRTRTVCVVTAHTDTNTCQKCKTPWSYQPRQCAEHCFHPRCEGPPRKKRPYQPKESVGRSLKQLGRDLGRSLKSWFLNDVHMVTVEEMIERIQDEDKLYFRDYKLRDLHRHYLMPGAERLAVHYVVDEEVECDYRQPFFMPGVITQVHPNDTYDIMFSHGELLKNALRWTIRGRSIYKQWPWTQVVSMSIFFGLLFLPAAAGGVPSKALENCAAVFWLMTTAILAAMLHHVWSIFRSHSPLRPRFKNKIIRLWLSPFLVLWVFATAALCKAGGVFISLPWSLLLVLSYVFSILFTMWLALAKPVYGLFAAALTLPWVLAQLAVGLWLDDHQGGRVPLVAVLLPLWLFAGLVVAWHQWLMPYTWDGSLPTLSVIDWPVPQWLKDKMKLMIKRREQQQVAEQVKTSQGAEQGHVEDDEAVKALEEGGAPQQQYGGGEGMPEAGEGEGTVLRESPLFEEVEGGTEDTVYKQMPQQERQQQEEQVREGQQEAEEGKTGERGDEEEGEAQPSNISLNTGY